MEDLDDDGDSWSDLDEVLWQSTLDVRRTPGDPDGDGLCNALDLDDDGDGWSDEDEWACETRNNARYFQPHTSSAHSYSDHIGAALGYHYGTLQMVRYENLMKIYTYDQPTFSNSPLSPRSTDPPGITTTTQARYSTATRCSSRGTTPSTGSTSTRVAPSHP